MFKTPYVKKGLFIIAIIMIISMFAARYCFSNSMSTTYDQQITYFSEISTKDVEKKIQNKDQFLLYIGRSTCPFCRDLVSVLYNLISSSQLEYEIFYLDSQNTPTDLALQTFRNAYHVETVPAILFFSNNSVYNINLHLEDEGYSEGKILFELKTIVSNEGGEI